MFEAEDWLLPTLFGSACGAQPCQGPPKLCNLWFYLPGVQNGPGNAGDVDKCTSQGPCGPPLGLGSMSGRGTLLYESQPVLLHPVPVPWAGGCRLGVGRTQRPQLSSASWPQFPHRMGGDTLATVLEVISEKVSRRVEYTMCTCEDLLFLFGKCQQRVSSEEREFGARLCINCLGTTQINGYPMVVSPPPASDKSRAWKEAA